MIRRFTPPDAEVVSALIRTTMAASNVQDYPLERLQPLIDYFTPAKVAALAAERHCLVAEADGRVVGTAALDGDEVVTCFVHPDAQGAGVGTQLLSALEGVARGAGARRLCVQASLRGAPFYARRGFMAVGEQVEGVAGPHVPMAKLLESSVARDEECAPWHTGDAGEMP